MQKNTYGRDFYRGRHQATVYSARAVLSIVLDALPPVHSAVDFGCGVGTWLSVLQEKGVGEIQGLDGSWVEPDLLEIPQKNFRQVTFDERIAFDRRYDLAISLEVAEHLPERNAGGFVDSLAAASDFILFSAAIPFQGGISHVNEQWPGWWADVFAGRGYKALDVVRRNIWNDRQIPAWYRQNILLFAAEGHVHRIAPPAADEHDTAYPISLVHPDIYLSKVDQLQSVKNQLQSAGTTMQSVTGSWKLFRKALKKYVRNKLAGLSGKTAEPDAQQQDRAREKKHP